MSILYSGLPVVDRKIPRLFRFFRSHIFSGYVLQLYRRRKALSTLRNNETFATHGMITRATYALPSKSNTMILRNKLHNFVARISAIRCKNIVRWLCPTQHAFIGFRESCLSILSSPKLNLNFLIHFCNVICPPQDKLPPTSNAIPLLGVYYEYTIVEVSLAMFVACLLMRIYYPENSSSPLPLWAKVNKPYSDDRLGPSNGV